MAGSGPPEEGYEEGVIRDYHARPSSLPHLGIQQRPEPRPDACLEEAPLWDHDTEVGIAGFQESTRSPR